MAGEARRGRPIQCADRIDMKTILIADNEEEIGTLIHSMLTSPGYRI